MEPPEFIPENKEHITVQRTQDKDIKCIDVPKFIQQINNGEFSLEKLNTTDYFNDTMFTCVCNCGDSHPLFFELVNAMIQKGVNVNHVNVNGWTALHYSSRNHNKRLVKILLDMGAKTNVKNVDGNTPIEICDKNIKHYSNNKFNNSPNINAPQLIKEYTEVRDLLL